MKRTVILAATLLALPALGATHKCKGMKKDGSLIAEFEYETGKYSECSNKVKAAAAALCTPGQKKYEFQFQKDDEKARTSFADCSLAQAAPAQEEPAKADAAPVEAPAAGGGAPAASASCAEKQAWIVANSKWCDAPGIVKKQDCAQKNGALLVEKMFPKCISMMEKHETGDPGEAKCNEAYAKLEKDACGAAKIMTAKGNPCAKGAKERRSIVNSMNVCDKK